MSDFDPADPHEPEHHSSPTAHLLDELQLYGRRPSKTSPTRGRFSGIA